MYPPFNTIDGTTEAPFSSHTMHDGITDPSASGITDPSQKQLRKRPGSPPPPMEKRLKLDSEYVSENEQVLMKMENESEDRKTLSDVDGKQQDNRHTKSATPLSKSLKLDMDYAPEYKQALMKMKKESEERRTLSDVEHQNQELRTQLDQERGKIKTFEESLAWLRQENQRLDKLCKTKDDLAFSAEEWRDEFNREKRRTEELNGGLTTAEDHLTAAYQEVQTAKNHLTAAYEEIQSSKDEHKKDLDQKRALFKTKLTELANKHQEYTTVAKAWLPKVKTLDAQVQDYKADEQKLMTWAQGLGEQVNKLEGRVEKVLVEMKETRHQKLRMENAAKESRAEADDLRAELQIAHSMLDHHKATIDGFKDKELKEKLARQRLERKLAALKNKTKFVKLRQSCLSLSIFHLVMATETFADLGLPTNELAFVLRVLQRFTERAGDDWQVMKAQGRDKWGFFLKEHPDYSGFMDHEHEPLKEHLVDRWNISDDPGQGSASPIDSPMRDHGLKGQEYATTTTALAIDQQLPKEPNRQVDESGAVDEQKLEDDTEWLAKDAQAPEDGPYRPIVTEIFAGIPHDRAPAQPTLSVRTQGMGATEYQVSSSSQIWDSTQQVLEFTEAVESLGHEQQHQQCHQQQLAVATPTDPARIRSISQNVGAHSASESCSIAPPPLQGNSNVHDFRTVFCMNCTAQHLDVCMCSESRLFSPAPAAAAASSSVSRVTSRGPVSGVLGTLAPDKSGVAAQYGNVRSPHADHRDGHTIKDNSHTSDIEQGEPVDDVAYDLASVMVDPPGTLVSATQEHHAKKIGLLPVFYELCQGHHQDVHFDVRRSPLLEPIEPQTQTQTPSPISLTFPLTQTPSTGPDLALHNTADIGLTEIPETQSQYA